MTGKTAFVLGASIAASIIIVGAIASVAVIEHKEEKFRLQRFLKLQESYMNSGACEYCENRRWFANRTSCPVCNPKGDKDIEPLPFNLRIPHRGKIHEPNKKDKHREDQLTSD